MTLEKLLIFGFGIAVVTALAVAASTIKDNRAPQYDGYRDKVETLVERANP